MSAETAAAEPPLGTARTLSGPTDFCKGPNADVSHEEPNANSSIALAKERRAGIF